MKAHKSKTWFAVRSYFVAKEFECDCPQCAAPVYVGDSAFEVTAVDPEPVETGFCCRGCAIAWARDHDPRARASACELFDTSDAFVLVAPPGVDGAIELAQEIARRDARADLKRRQMSLAFEIPPQSAPDSRV